MRSIVPSGEIHTRPAPPKAKRQVEQQQTTIVRPDSTQISFSRSGRQLLDEYVVRGDPSDEDSLDGDADSFAAPLNILPYRTRKEINAVI
jgi:hypothetical protein